MTDIVEYLEKHGDEFNEYDFHQQYAPDTDGLTLNDDLAFPRMEEKYGQDEVWGGISGERDLRRMLKTDLFDGNLTREHFEGGFTSDEWDDIINYHAWNTYDLLALRASEGKSEIIPRQQYEFLGFTWSALRWPEYFKALIDLVGIEGIIEAGKNSRKELGTSLILTPLAPFTINALGFIGLEGLDMIDADDPVIADKKKTVYTVGLALAHGIRGEDGFVRASQNRYVNDVKDQEVIDFVTDQLVPLDETTKTEFREFNAAGELLAFLMYYDNRVGLMDHGPYLNGDGKPMIMREIGLNRPFLPWNDITESRDLPYTATTAFVIDPNEISLQEIRGTELSTISAPSNYLDAIEAGAVFFRHEPPGVEPLPLDELEIVDIHDDLPDLTARIKEGVQEWYNRIPRLSRRTLIWNGATGPYVVAHLSYLLRATGCYEYFQDSFDLWEAPPMISDVYYHTMGGYAEEEIPTQIITGLGWSEIPAEPATESRYADALAEAREMNWISDLSGMNDIPSYWKEKMNEHDLLDVPLTKMKGEIQLDDVDEFLKTL